MGAVNTTRKRYNIVKREQLYKKMKKESSGEKGANLYYRNAQSSFNFLRKGLMNNFKNL